MLYCDIDLTKSNGIKICMICHFCIFNHGFKFQDYNCDFYHDLTMLRLNISGITITTVNGVDYGSIINDISNSETIRL